MLVIICLVLLVILLFTINSFASRYGHEITDIISCVLGIIVSVSLLGVTAVAVMNHVTVNANTAALQQQYKSLTYQLENVDALYGNSRANDKKELYNQIQEWNKDVARGRTMHESIWTNWLQPIDYGNLEYIEMK